MSDRISIAELRAGREHQGDDLDIVLALVEAVEAAHLAMNTRRAPGAFNNVWNTLGEALDRFDFEERP